MATKSKETTEDPASAPEATSVPATRTVRMLSLAAGPDGILCPGAVIEVPAAQAEALIAARAAEEVPRE